ncbi:MAG: hypothetical protein HDR31_01570 [Mycoplasma sp.]|nr:hypothetical protein [Mycoplasma sp.]
MKIKNNFYILKNKFLNKIKSKKIKTLILTCASVISISVIVIFISIFANQSNEPKISATDYTNSKGMKLNLAKDIMSQKENLNFLINSVFDKQNNTYNFYFGEDKIKNYIFNIVNDALQNNEDFDDSPSDYSKTVRYKFLSNQKQVIINLFLYNKTIKSKKYISNFKISII